MLAAARSLISHYRATTACALAAAAALVTAATPAHAIPIPEGGGALPEVNMERLVLAATLDPHRVGDGGTDGARTSVRLVEDALADKGLLGRTYVDDSFGSMTIDAWGRWENRIHGEVGNKLPGLAEVRQRGDGRFTLNHVYDVGDWVWENGEKTTKRTLNMFHEAERLSGNMTITQGWGDAPASAGTHLGGGMLDVSVRQADGDLMTSAQISDRVSALRKVGFAAWYRNWSGNQHIHAVAINDYLMPLATHTNNCQIAEYRFGGDGLGCDRSDNTAAWRDAVTWESYLRNTP